MLFLLERLLEGVRRRLGLLRLRFRFRLPELDLSSRPSGRFRFGLVLLFVGIPVGDGRELARTAVPRKPLHFAEMKAIRLPKLCYRNFVTND